MKIWMPGMVPHAFNSQGEAGGSLWIRIRGRPGQHGEFEASLNYKVISLSLFLSVEKEKEEEGEEYEVCI